MLTPPRAAGPFVPGIPEQSFAVSALTPLAGGFRATMITGPRNHGPSGQPCAGTLGVLVDVTLGACVAVHAHTGATVSSEMSLDLLRAVPADGREITCTSTVVEIGEHGGLARGEVVDADGHRIAVATQRQRFVPPPGPDRVGVLEPHPAVDEPAFDESLDALDLLKATAFRTDDACRLVVAPGPHVANPAA